MNENAEFENRRKMRGARSVEIQQIYQQNIPVWIQTTNLAAHQTNRPIYG
ncbi:hypothetical protein AG1IA_03030 [Rhizoctonia solani AG-1 IA]|uniref:Uncharacterized protein n=1 Tax=Thanatephorus cucumeris (strain AG1-IA) TaxID=983506 RepID=L8X2T7_THACA|nr:hypothetical protein AG1IA_03030 [Rhizoctonia solani AG-1 IA]